MKPVWKYIPPPYEHEKPITLFGPPQGAVRVTMRTPKETIQMIGTPEGKVPERVSIDLGVADILILDSGRRIEYRGGGLETDVGKRISSPTTGMSISSNMPILKHKKPRRKEANPSMMVVKV